MTLLEHAQHELELAGYGPPYDDDEFGLDEAIYNSTLDIVKRFSEVGHSGASAQAHKSLINLLLGFESLGPITDNSDEWMEVGDDWFQNTRNSALFSDDGGKTYYSVDEFRYGWKATLFGRKGKTYKSQPV